MRKLLLQVQTTVDGYMGGPKGEMDWMSFNWSPDVGEYITAMSAGVDTIVLGRKLAEGFIPAWESRPEHEDDKAIDWMINTPKVVVSESLTESPWANATIANGDVAATIDHLKAQPGGDLIVYGGSTLVTSLIAKNLIDDLHLFVNPIAIGAGIPVFAPGAYTPLRQVAATPFECGITALHFAPKVS